MKRVNCSIKTCDVTFFFFPRSCVFLLSSTKNKIAGFGLGWNTEGCPDASLPSLKTIFSVSNTCYKSILLFSLIILSRKGPFLCSSRRERQRKLIFGQVPFMMPIFCSLLMTGNDMLILIFINIEGNLSTSWKAISFSFIYEPNTSCALTSCHWPQLWTYHRYAETFHTMWQIFDTWGNAAENLTHEAMRSIILIHAAMLLTFDTLRNVANIWGMRQCSWTFDTWGDAAETFDSVWLIFDT